MTREIIYLQHSWLFRMVTIWMVTIRMVIDRGNRDVVLFITFTELYE